MTHLIYHPLSGWSGLREWNPAADWDVLSPVRQHAGDVMADRHATDTHTAHHVTSRRSTDTDRRPAGS